MVLEVYVAEDEHDSSRINVNVDLMAAVNDELLAAYNIDADQPCVPSLGAHGWALLYAADSNLGLTPNIEHLWVQGGVRGGKGMQDRHVAHLQV